MQKRSVISRAAAGLLTLLLTAGTLALAWYSIAGSPLILAEPAGAYTCAEDFLKAVSAGDLTAARQYLYGAPEISSHSGEGASAALWRCYYSSLQAELSRSVTAEGLHLLIPLSVTCLPVSCMLDALGESDVDPGDADALNSALEALCSGGLMPRTVLLDLKLTLSEGRWQIIPSQKLLDLITGQVIE